MEEKPEYTAALIRKFLDGPAVAHAVTSSDGDSSNVTHDHNLQGTERLSATNGRPAQALSAFVRRLCCPSHRGKNAVNCANPARIPPGCANVAAKKFLVASSCLPGSAVKSFKILSR
jgi:hypothetical protein